ncbi:SP15 protein, partial [Hemiprocne comata]|nr:SP15 protein [Hemiprocne comata]
SRTMPLSRPTGQIPEATWTLGIREMTEPWKGALGCLGVAVFFAMTIGIISWQALEQSPEEWVLRGGAGGMVWVEGTLKTFQSHAPHGQGHLSLDQVAPSPIQPALEHFQGWGSHSFSGHPWSGTPHLPKTPCMPCTFDSCHDFFPLPTLTPLAIFKQDCFSMANVSWYGGVSTHAPRWPLNGAESQAQPFVSGDLGRNPGGFGPVLDRYFLGSTGVTVTVAPDVPLFLSLESNQHFCLGTPAGTAAVPLRYRLCLSPDLAAAQQHVGSQLGGPARARPDTALLGAPVWRYHGPEGSASKIKRGLRSLARRLKRHGLQEGVLALGERGTAVLTAMDDTPRGQEAGGAWAPSLVAPLQLSITLSPYAPVASPLFLRSLQDSRATSSWLSLPPRPGGCSVPLLTMWKGQLCARLNVTSEEALSWYLARARRLQQELGATYVVFEGAEGNTFLEQALPPPAELQGDQYTQVLAAALATLGNATIISAGARSSHLPLFIQMSPLRSDWSHAGLKGLIPSVLHYSLLGYNFFIPDAVGGSLAGDTPGDPELYVRWLQIVTFLPVMAFSTPPWICCDTWVLNLTRQCIQRHRDFVVPLLIKSSEEWLRLGHPIFRPAWWLSPTDPTAFTIEDEFLIGDEVLVAPVTERGHTWRDIYLPGAGHLWMDTSTARLFDGGTILRNYSAGLTEVPVFVK